MTDDFRARLVAHAQASMDRAGRAQTEAATQQYLVLPFFQLLGYDPLDPDEVIPEAHASFSDKFKNRVDYAICKEKEPVMAVECKKVGTLAEGHRGELKGYFNAVPTVKLGILTDGLVFQLYSDTQAPNMMDDEPFVVVDLAEAAQNRIRMMRWTRCKSSAKEHSIPPMSGRTPSGRYTLRPTSTLWTGRSPSPMKLSSEP